MTFLSYRSSSLARARGSRPASKGRQPFIRLRLEQLESRTVPTITAVPQQFTTPQYTALSIAQSQMLVGDSGSGPLTVSNPTQPANATLVDNHNGTYTFTPNPGFTGSTTFQYTVSDASPTELTTPNLPGGPDFGNSVAIDGDTIAIGARFQQVNGNNDAGAVYVFVRSGTTWNQQAEIIPPDSTPGQAFGSSVSISGDTILAGNGFTASQGAAYVYMRSGTTWSEQAKLTAVDGSSTDQFGLAVAVSGDTAVIDAPNKPVQGFTIAGAAYVFVRTGTTWTQQAELSAANVAGASFIAALSLSGDTFVIGANASDMDTSHFRGVAFVYVRSGTTWSQQAELSSPAGFENDGFGRTVSISGDTILIGADVTGEDITSFNAATFQGAAYVFVRSGTTWAEQAELTNANPRPGEGFGSSVALSGDTAIVDAGLSEQPIGLYVFVRSGTTWTQQVNITNPTFNGVDFLSDLSTVAISGTTVILGEPGLMVTGPNTQGAAFVQDLEDSTTATASVQVNAATAELFVAPASLPSGTEGQSYPDVNLTVTGGANGGYTLQQSGVLPSGITFNSTTGVFSGTLLHVGTYSGIVIAASDGQGDSGSQTYVLTVTHYGVNGFPAPYPQVIYAPSTSKTDPNADLEAYIRGLYHSILDRDAEPGGSSLPFWENVFSLMQNGASNPLNLSGVLPPGTDPYQYVADGIWQSQEHRWDEVQTYYQDLLGRTLDLTRDNNVAEGQYWVNQFVFAGAAEEAVIRGFLSSPEYLFNHRTDASLANSLNTNLLKGMATSADLQTWTAALSALDAQRAAIQNQTFSSPETYMEQLSSNLGALDDEATGKGVLFDMLGSAEYQQGVLSSFYQAFLRRAGTAAEKQALLAQIGPNGNPLSLGTIAELMVASPEYRTNAVKSEV